MPRNSACSSSSTLMPPAHEEALTKLTEWFAENTNAILMIAQQEEGPEGAPQDAWPRG